MMLWRWDTSHQWVEKLGLKTSSPKQVLTS